MEEKERFLAAAYRFLSEVSYGGPEQRLSYPLPTTGMAISPSSPREDAHKIVTAQEWLQTASKNPHHHARVRLLPAKGGHAMCLFSYQAYVPLSARKAKGRMEADAMVEDIFRQPSGKVQSYRHLLPGLTLVDEEKEEDIYDPDYLDNPELKTGRHRTVIALTSFMVLFYLHNPPESLSIGFH